MPRNHSSHHYQQPNHSRRAANRRPPSNPSRIRELIYHLHAYDEKFTFISPCIKYSLFFFNFIIWIVGCLLIALGAWSFLEEYNDTLINIRGVVDVFLHISLAIIVMGSIVFIMSFTGCIGALRENLFFLKIYSLLLVLLFMCEVIVSGTAFLFPSAFMHHIKKWFSTDPINKYRDDSNLQNLIDVVQTNLGCCGISDNGYKDWSNNVYFDCRDSNPSRERCAVPYSCCRNARNLDSGLINYECGFNMQNISSVVEVGKYIYTRGCIEAMSELIEPNLTTVSAVLVIFAVIQLFAVLLARSLQGQVMAQRSRWAHH